MRGVAFATWRGLFFSPCNREELGKSRGLARPVWGHGGAGRLAGGGRSPRSEGGTAGNVGGPEFGRTHLSPSLGWEGALGV